MAAERSGLLDDVWNVVAHRTGFALSGARRSLMESRLQLGMQQAGFADLDAYVDRLSRDGALLDDLVEALLVGETYFFREPGQCRFIAEEVLPELRARHGGSGDLRLWSAGCASGEEPYTLAILLDEAERAGAGAAAGAELAPRAPVLGTDISRAALQRARDASYRPWSLRGLAGPRLEGCFERTENGFRVREQLRRRVVFDQLNLVQDSYPSLACGVWAMDLIVCRNVLIYFDPATVADVARRLWASLGDGGWLITGSSDPPLQQLAAFETIQRPEGVFYRRGGAGCARPLVVVPGPTPAPPPSLPALPPAPRAPLPAAAATPRPAPAAPTAPTLAEVERRLRAGDYEDTIRLARALEDQPGACALRVRALANLHGPVEAAAACRQALERHQFSVELHYLMAALLLALGRDEQALAEARRVVYLDRALVVGHLLQATILKRLGDAEGARRVFTLAGRLAEAGRDGEPVPLGEEQSWATLRAAVRTQLELLAPAAGGAG
jgi:chemotaxis protein methyltransferase CheR